MHEKKWFGASNLYKVNQEIKLCRSEQNCKMSLLLGGSSSARNSSGEDSNSSFQTNSDHERPEILPLSLILLLSLVCLLVVIVNSFVMFLLHKKRTLRTLRTNMFLGSLAISDLLSGLVGIPLFAICLDTDIIDVCVSSTIFIRFTAISSVCHVLLIAVDRYIFIVHYMEYHGLVTKRRALFAVVTVWLFSSVASVIQLSWYIFYQVAVTDSENITNEFNKHYSLACLVIFFALPLLSMCSIYGRIFYISVKRKNSHHKMSNIVQQPCQPQSHEWRGRSVLVIAIVIFASCWLPYFVAMLNDHMNDSENTTMQLHMQRLLVFVGLIPPISNPILCTLAKKDFRRALKELLLRRKTNMPAAVVVHREQICL